MYILIGTLLQERYFVIMFNKKALLNKMLYNFVIRRCFGESDSPIIWYENTYWGI